MPLPVPITMVQPQVALEKYLNKEIIVELKDQRTLKGILMGFDEHMNLVLEQAEEKGANKDRRLGTVLLRGNNVISISTTN
jgi:small nuclear ribonucleoprotein